MEEPTAEQCAKEERVPDIDGQPAYACWYPQMGGYVGKCIVALSGNGCFEAYVWHDGSFPFKEDDGQPLRIHHCDAGQFVYFGQKVERMQEALCADQ